MTDAIDPAAVTIVPANEASWADLRAVFGTGEAGRCCCQRFVAPGWFWESTLATRRIVWRDRDEDKRDDTVFAEAGFREVSRPSTRRVVMRVDFP